MYNFLIQNWSLSIKLFVIKSQNHFQKMTSILVIFPSDEFVTSHLEMSSHP